MSTSADSRTHITNMHSYLKPAPTQAKRLGRTIELQKLHEQEAERKRLSSTMPLVTKAKCASLFGYDIVIHDQSTGFVLIYMAQARSL